MERGLNRTVKRLDIAFELNSLSQVPNEVNISSTRHVHFNAWTLELGIHPSQPPATLYLRFCVNYDLLGGERTVNWLWLFVNILDYKFGIGIVSYILIDFPDKDLAV